MTEETTYLRSLKSIREKCSLLLSHPEHLQHFIVDLDKMTMVVDLVLSLIKRDYASPDSIPPHSRQRHFEAAKNGINDRVGALAQKWRNEGIDSLEIVRKTLDLFVIGSLSLNQGFY